MFVAAAMRRAYAQNESGCLLELEPPAHVGAEVAERGARDVVDVVVRGFDAHAGRESPFDVRAHLARLGEAGRHVGADTFGEALADRDRRLGAAGFRRIRAAEAKLVDDRDGLRYGA